MAATAGRSAQARRLVGYEAREINEIYMELFDPIRVADKIMQKCTLRNTHFFFKRFYEGVSEFSTQSSSSSFLHHRAGLADRADDVPDD